MTRKKWILLVLFILLIAGWFKLFYKTWNNERVTKNTDCIITLDVKKITNTFIWNFITTPSQWKSSNWFSSSKEGKVSWDDMISLPDYVFIFHRTGEPNNAFYTVVDINDKQDFVKGLQQYHFEKTVTGSYLSKETGIEFIQNGDKLLIGNAAVEDKSYLQKVSAELFTQNKIITEDSLAKTVNAGSHLAIDTRLFSSSIFEGEYIIQGNFDDEKLVVSTVLPISKAIHLNTTKFNYTDSSLLSFGCTQPGPDIKKILPATAWSNISKTVNFNIDSLLLQTNQQYRLDVTGIYPRIDSAVSYTYDDDFNPIEKVVVNKVEEPAFNFIVQGNSVEKIYDYWISSGTVEKNGDSSLFTPVPFVKSYCRVENKNILMVTANNYKAAPSSNTIDCMLFLKIVLTKLPPSLLHYLPVSASPLLKNIETVEAIISNKKEQTILEVYFNKKKNDLPLVEF